MLVLDPADAGQSRIVAATAWAAWRSTTWPASAWPPPRPAKWPRWTRVTR
ncbi:hypothetical protein [Arenimonas daejeonensis]|nr:hypothetical protein [Arenimonas daejeonensis]